MYRILSRGRLQLFLGPARLAFVSPAPACATDRLLLSSSARRLRPDRREEDEVKISVDSVYSKYKEVRPNSVKGNARARIRELMELFPFSHVSLQQAVLESQNLLDYSPDRIFEFCKALVECSDYMINQEEAVYFLGQQSEYMKYDLTNFRQRVSDMFAQTSDFTLPWNSIIVQHPEMFSYKPQAVVSLLHKLNRHFNIDEIYDLAGNSPDLFGQPLDYVEEKLHYLVRVMGVSHRRISITTGALSLPLDDLKVRYEFLFRCGTYKHPNPNFKGKFPDEATPLLHKLVCPSDHEFLKTAAAGITFEEFVLFRGLLQEGLEEETGEIEYDDEEENDEDEDVDPGYLREEQQKKASKKKQRRIPFN